MVNLQLDQHKVRDRERVLTFAGIVLAESSSRKHGAYRWTELRLYRTVSDTYVLEKIGRSIVTHVPSCSAIRGAMPRFQAKYPGEDPEFGFEYHDCVPDEYDFTELLVEADLCWGLHTADPAEVIDALYLRLKALKNHTIPQHAKTLLDAASLVDAKFNELWTVQVTAS